MMKFKQKLEQMKQMFLEGLQCLVSKPRVLITNLTARLRGNTKSETTGQRRTRRQRQRDRLLNHLSKGKTITCLNSYSELGITQLAYYVKDLKERGHNINTERKEFVNCHNEIVKVVEYSLGSK